MANATPSANTDTSQLASDLSNAHKPEQMSQVIDQLAELAKDKEKYQSAIKDMAGKAKLPAELNLADFKLVGLIPDPKSQKLDLVVGASVPGKGEVRVAVDANGNESLLKL